MGDLACYRHFRITGCAHVIESISELVLLLGGLQRWIVWFDVL